MSESNTGKIVYFTLQPDLSLPLTSEDHAPLDHLATMQDDEIDFSDIPKQTNFTGWARPGPMRDVIADRMANCKQGDITQTEGQQILIQSDVLSLFTERGEATEEKINEVLRHYVETRRRSA